MPYISEGSACSSAKDGFRMGQKKGDCLFITVIISSSHCNLSSGKPRVPEKSRCSSFLEDVGEIVVDEKIYDTFLRD